MSLVLNKNAPSSGRQRCPSCGHTAAPRTCPPCPTRTTGCRDRTAGLQTLSFHVPACLPLLTSFGGGLFLANTPCYVTSGEAGWQGTVGNRMGCSYSTLYFPKHILSCLRKADHCPGQRGLGRGVVPGENWEGFLEELPWDWSCGQSSPFSRVTGVMAFPSP